MSRIKAKLLRYAVHHHRLYYYFLQWLKNLFLLVWFARCMKCEGCTSPACGICSSCKIYSQFKDKIRDPVTCEQIVCKFPISLFQTSQKVDKSMRHEDGCCPLKVINGSVYDFQCYFCKFLPHVGSANRSELYRHYSTVHFQNELKAEFGNNFTCNNCNNFTLFHQIVQHF